MGNQSVDLASWIQTVGTGDKLGPRARRWRGSEPQFVWAAAAGTLEIQQEPGWLLWVEQWVLRTGNGSRGDRGLDEKAP